MKAEVECIPCVFKQALAVSRYITDDPVRQQRVLDEVMRAMEGVSLERAPADISDEGVKIVYKMLAGDDPYREAKHKHNQAVLELYPRLKDIMDKADDRLHTALQLAAAGNIIDLGIVPTFDIEKTIEEVLSRGFAVDHYDQLMERLPSTKNILYIGDNAGEIVFDKLLIEELKPLSVTFAVKSGPILNDVTEEDAREVGMDKVARVISTGQRMIGVNLSEASPEFRRLFEKAEIIISKGQGNYETLEGVSDRICFILRAKCGCVARSLGVREGDVVLLRKS